MSATLDARIDGFQLVVAAVLDTDLAEVELCIESERNRAVTRVSRPSVPQAALWLPVVDVQLEPGLDAVVRLDAAGEAACTVNGWAGGTPARVGRQARILSSRLEQWENAIYVRGQDLSLRWFALCEQVRPVARRLERRYALLSQQWRGAVSLRGPEGELARVEVAHEPLPVLDAVPRLNLDGIRAALGAALRFMLRGQNRAPESRLHMGLPRLYDHAVRAFRGAHEAWAWGPPIAALLAATEAQGACDPFEGLRMARRARAAAETSLELSAPGGWARDLSQAGGYAPAPPDRALFLAGWAWAPMFERSAKERYLRAAERAAAAVLGSAGALQGGDMGWAALLRATGERRWLAPLRRCADRVALASHPDPWPVLALIAAHASAPQEGFGERALRAARAALDAQQEGGWPDAERPAERTAGWAAALYRLYRLTGERDVLHGAHRALRWCVNRQAAGADHDAHGSLTDGQVSYLLATALFSLALVEALSWPQAQDGSRTATVL